ncbi:MAG TPA: hypothetical protein VGL09_04955 [Methylomirabilota bacterium]
MVVSLHHFLAGCLAGIERGVFDVRANGLIESTVKHRRRQFGSKLAKVLYVASVFRVRPRGIDRYIDYFGDGMFGPSSHPAISGVSLGAGAAIARRRVS